MGHLPKIVAGVRPLRGDIKIANEHKAVVTAGSAYLGVEIDRIKTIDKKMPVFNRETISCRQVPAKKTHVNIDRNILGYAFTQYVDLVKSFHGYPAPGVLIGGFMVDLAYHYLPEEGLFDVICETRKCLPDAVQLLTPCTVGNGWLRVIDISRFAFAIYDKQNGGGIRISINYPKLDAWPEIKGWFTGTSRDKHSDGLTMINQIKEAGSSICNAQPVNIEIPVRPIRSNDHAVCPFCGESHALVDGKICIANQLPYKIMEIKSEHPLNKELLSGRLNNDS